MTEDFCKKSLAAHNEPEYFFDHGGMKKFGGAVSRGMTMVLSFWDDMQSNMNWLDSHGRGVCDPSLGDPKRLREKHPDAKFGIRHVRWGDIGTTHLHLDDVVV